MNSTSFYISSMFVFDIVYLSLNFLCLMIALFQVRSRLFFNFAFVIKLFDDKEWYAE